MKTGSNIRQRKDGRYEARYIKKRDSFGNNIWGYCYGLTYEEAEEKRNAALGLLLPVKENNLLILGAGDHGQEVKEIAESLRVFSKIDFLDDDESKMGVIGSIKKLSAFKEMYSVAIPAVGDNALRTKWMINLIREGYVIPTLIHPSATISNSAVIGPGTVICAGATVGLNAKIGRGCIIDSGALVDRNAVVPDWFCIDCGIIFPVRK